MHKERILILDDEASILELLGQTLRQVDPDCTLTTSPLKALEHLKTGQYALLVTDLRMPEMNGNEVVRRAREMDPDLAVIVITGLMEVTSAIESMRAGADDYLLKPFNIEEIRLSAERALERRRLILENRQHQLDLESRVHEATRELRETKEYLENLINSSVDAILTIDANGKVSYANQGANDMFGYEPDVLLGKKLADLLHGGEEEAAHIQRIMDQKPPLKNYETDFRHNHQDKISVNMSMSWVKNADGKIISYIVICKDITTQKRLEEELKELSIKDNLTGLFNQRYFYSRLEMELKRARRQAWPLTLMLFDVDRFKYFNDTRGHLEGDRVLQAIGEVVTESTRTHVDLGFRYGGDEFTIILTEADEEIGILIANRVRNGFSQKNFDRLTLSIGLAACWEDCTTESLTRAADMMMYESKRAGGNRISIYNPESMSALLEADSFIQEGKISR